MKKWNVVFAVIFLSLSVAVSGKTSQRGQRMDAVTWAKHVTAGWNLGNTLESYSSKGVVPTETSWGNPVTTQEMIDGVKAAGFNAVRIPVRWSPHFTYSHGVVTLDAAWVKRVREVIGYCLKDGMQVIINTHHDGWLENHALYADTAEVLPRLRALWTAIARAFGDYDGRLAFAGTNEVHIRNLWGKPTAENAAVQNTFNQTFIHQVRATGGNNFYRNLIVQTYACNDDWGPALLTVPRDPSPRHLMVEVHCYDPWNYGGEDHEKYWGTPFAKYGDAKEGQEQLFVRLFGQLKSLFVDRGIPVVIGECGAIRHKTTEDTRQAIEASRAYYLETVVSMARRSGIVPFFWDNGVTGDGSDSFGLFQRRNGMLPVDNYSIPAIMKGVRTAYS